jgi:hypothetical protein
MNQEVALKEYEAPQDSCSLQAYLLGQDDIEVQPGDEKGVALPWDAYSYFSYDFEMAPGIRSLAKDVRFPNQQVGIVTDRELPLNKFINRFLIDKLQVHPRREAIDRRTELSKVVFVGYVQAGDYVVAIPRVNTELVDNALTLSVFESGTVEDFSGAAEINSQGDITVHDYRLLFERAVKEECPYFPFDKLIFSGLVGGRVGDFGLVCGYETNIQKLKEIASKTGGMVIDAYHHNWTNIARQEGFRADGWSNVILQVIQRKQRARRISMDIPLQDNA